MVKSGVVPSSWFGITETMSARKLLKLLDEVKKRGIDVYDLPAVRAVWIEMTRGFATMETDDE